jgi:protein SCO1/2
MPFFVWLLTFMAIVPWAWAGDAVATPEEALKKSQQAIGRIIKAEHKFKDSQRKERSLADYRGKPLVLSLVYTSCIQTCPSITQTIARSVAAARDALGEKSFNVISIGFDTNVDTPEAMAIFAKRQEINFPEWEFLSGDPLTVAQISEELGFTYYRSPTKGFDHLTQTTILDGEGKVYQQVYGELFDIPLLVEPLKDLVWGRGASFSSFDSMVNRVKIFCTVYDPRTDAYRIDYSIFLETFMGIVFFASVVAFLVNMNRKRDKGAGSSTEK